MTDDAWELIEYRIWNRFRARLWALVAGILTVAALLSLLGVDGWIRYRIDTVLKAQSERIDMETRQALQKISTMSNGWVLLQAMNDRVQQELEIYDRERSTIERDFPSETASMKGLQGLRSLFTWIPGAPDEETFSSAVAAFPPPTPSDSFRGQLEGLKFHAIHITAIRIAVRNLRSNLLHDEANDLDAIEAMYRKDVYDVYASEIVRLHGYTGKGLDSSWNLLPTRLEADIPKDPNRPDTSDLRVIER